jgi:hypothetical protein
VWMLVKVVRASAEFMEPGGGAVVTGCVSGSKGCRVICSEEMSRTYGARARCRS